MTQKPRHHRLVSALALSLAAGISLSGCSVGEVVRQQAGTAACSLITPFIDQVATDVQDAVSTTGVDPAQAVAKLKAARTVLQGISAQVTEGAQLSDVQAAVNTLDKLIPLIESAATGSADTAAIAKLQKQLAAEITTLTKIC